MNLARKRLTIRTDIWREGAYLDLWSVPHFLSGLVLGLALFFTGLPLVYAFVSALVLLVLYEMWEAWVQIEETRWNRVLDVVVGMTSCTLALIYAPVLTFDQVVFVCVTAVLLDIGLSYSGWRASQKAAIFEAEVRREIAERRQRILARVRGGRFHWKKNLSAD